MTVYPLSKTFAGRKVLDFPGITLEAGRIYGIIGANGSGKSTFASILAGTLRADGGEKVSDAASVGFMPQRSFAFRMSTRNNLLLSSNDPEKADRLLDAFGLTELREKRADRLSGGETARMALARLMMKSFELVILDEPCAAMDMETTLISEKMITAYVKTTGCALILITHSLQQAKRISDHIMYFHKGCLLEYGTKEKLLCDPEKTETREFLEFYGA